MAIDDTLTIKLNAAPSGVGSTVSAHPPMQDGFSFAWALTATDEDWPSPDWWVNPLDNTLSLRPLQMSTTWPTTTSGAYARLRKTHFSLTSADWDEIEVHASGDYFLLSKGTNEEISTLREYEANQPFFLTLRAFATAGDSFEMCKVTFGQYVVKLYANGQMRMTGGELPAAGRMGRFVRGAERNVSGELIQLLILPYKRRHILFYSPSHEGGWIFRDGDAPGTNADSEITEAGPLKVQFANSQGMVQAMHAVFPETAEFTTPVRYLSIPPTSEQSPSLGTAQWDVPDGCGVAASVIEADSTSGITWDGSKTGYRVKFVLLGASGLAQSPDGRPNWTPFVYGVRITMPAGTATRTSDESDVTDDCTELNLTFGYSRDGIIGKMTLLKGETHGGTALLHNRIVQVLMGTDPVFIGVANDPERTFGPNEDLRAASWTLESILSARAKSTQMPAHAPFDGEKVTDVVKYLFELVGATADADRVIPDLGDLAMPDSGHEGAPACPVEAGQTVDYWLRRIEELTGYTFDERLSSGSWVFRMFHPADTTSSVKTFYLTRAAQVGAAVGDDHICWEYAEKGILPEANELAIDYCDADGNHCLMCVVDEDSQNAELDADEQPVNWLGERRWAMLRESRVRDDGDIRRYLRALIDRPGVMDPVRVATWKAQWDPTVWPDDFVTIDSNGDFRVVAMQMSVVLDAETAFLRPCVYVGEKKDA